MASGIIKLSAFLSLIAVVSSAGEKCPGTANYTLSFYASLAFYGFSPLVGCSHGSDYVMWREGAMASAGVESVAETG